MESAFVRPLLLVMTLSLGACSQTLMTPTSGIDSTTAKQAAEAAVNALVEDTCRDAWLPTTYSSRDTPETQLGNRANNASRDGWCNQ